MDPTFSHNPLVLPRSLSSWSPRKSRTYQQWPLLSREDGKGPRWTTAKAMERDYRKSRSSFWTRPVFQYTFAMLLLGTLFTIGFIFTIASFIEDPVTIIISIDGFRAEYLQRNLTPNLMRLAQQGTRAEHLIPSFPTLTFPNHYSIVTGLYPSQHGIVGNVFHDPTLNMTFDYTNPAISRNPLWWGGEPIWVTAEQQGKVTGMLHWVGSDVAIKGTLPTHFASYAPTPLARNFEHVQQWLRLPRHARSRTQTRPQLLGIYLSDIDHVGHTHGPTSAELNRTLEELDAALGTFLAFLTTLPANVLVVSDHGMATSPTKLLIAPVLGDFADRVTVWFRGPLLLIDPHKATDRIPLYQHLQAQAEHFEVYLKENVPAHLHYSDNPRISSIVIIPENGYEFLSKEDTRLLGMHGYRMDTTRDMDAIFIAQGPAFEPQKVVPAFENVEIYSLLCKLLHILPAKNSGRGLSWMQ